MKKIMFAILIFADQCSAEISTVKSCPENQTGCYLVTERNGITSSASEGSRLYRRAQDWVANGGIVQPADVPDIASARADKVRYIRTQATALSAQYPPVFWDRGADYQSALGNTIATATSELDALSDIAAIKNYQPAWPSAPLH